MSEPEIPAVSEYLKRQPSLADAFNLLRQFRPFFPPKSILSFVLDGETYGLAVSYRDVYPDLKRPVFHFCFETLDFLRPLDELADDLLESIDREIDKRR